MYRTFLHLFSYTGSYQYHATNFTYSHFLVFTVDHLENSSRYISDLHYCTLHIRICFGHITHTHQVQNCSQPWKCWLFQSMQRRNGMMWNWNEFCKEENVFSDKADLCSHWGTWRCNASSQGLNHEAQGCEHKSDHLVTKNRTWCIMEALKKEG